MRHQQLWECFNTEREQLQVRLTRRIKENMHSLIGNPESADLLLVAADGRKLAAHLCILRQRAPVFFHRYIQPTFDATPRDHTSKQPILEVAVGDVDSSGLAFFIRSVYTEEEVANLPDEEGLMSQSMNEGGAAAGGHSNGSNPSDSQQQFNESEECNEQKENRRDHGGTTNHSASDSLEGSRTASTTQLNTLCRHSEVFPNQMTASYPSPTQLHTSSSSNLCNTTPLMTSFRELASSESQLCASGYSDISQLSEPEEEEKKRKVLRLMDSDVGSISSSTSCTPRQTNQQSKSIFPMFIGLGGEPCSKSSFEVNEVSEMSQSFPLTGSTNHYGFDSGAGTGVSSLTSSAGSNCIRSRAMNVRKLSVTSLSSLSSIGSMDMTPTLEGPLPTADQNPACRLAADLLQMYANQEDIDVVVITDDGELFAHRCILLPSCSIFRKQLQKTPTKLIMKGYSKQLIHFLLTFLYGGLTCITEDVDVWEVISLAIYLEIEELVDVAILHLKTHKCHFFHRPCATCVSAIFDALPQFHSISCLRRLYNEALVWQARHFTRIWKGRVFFHLSEQWQKECFNALLQEITEENVIDVLLGCEKLQVGLPRVKSQQAAQVVQQLVVNVVEYCMEFLTNSFDLVVSSKSLTNHGKGFALNLSLLEDIFPTLVHSLSADTAIKAFINLKNLLVQIQSPHRYDENGTPIEDWNPRFLNLCRRLFELVDKHLLHYAAAVTKSEAWDILSVQDQSRINEVGIFIEMKTPRAPPPKFSSFNRTYKRSSSAGAQSTEGIDRRKDRSVERSRPVATFSRLLEAPEPMEEVMEVERGQRETSLERSDHPTKIPAPLPLSASSSLSEQTKAETCENFAARDSTVSPTPKQKQNSSLQHVKTHRKSVGGGATPTVVRHKSPVKVMVDDENSLQRQNTHTVMTAKQHKETGINPLATGVPIVSNEPTLVAIKQTKPQSVVRPMPKNPAVLDNVANQQAVTRPLQNTTSSRSSCDGPPNTSATPDQTAQSTSKRATKDTQNRRPAADTAGQSATDKQKPQPKPPASQNADKSYRSNRQHQRKESPDAGTREATTRSRIPRSPKTLSKTKK